MGCVCCCLHGNNLEEQEHPAGRCVCLEHMTQLLEDMFHSLFPWRERVTPSDEQGAATVAPTLVQVNDRLDTDVSSPRPLSCTDPTCSQSQWQNDELVLGHPRHPVPLHEKSQLLRFENSMNTELTDRKENLNETKNEEGYRTSHSESSLKQPSVEMTAGVTYFHSASEDEDECPICFEEYTSENPRISLRCIHHYHLSCIYEWMERSETCPICSKMMLFKEDT